MAGDAQLYRARAVLYRRIGAWEEGVANLTRAIELDPRNTEMLSVLVVSYELLREYEQAYQTLDRILEIEPDNQFAIRRTPIVHVRAGDLPSVAAALEYPASRSEPFAWWVWWAALNERDFELAMESIDGWQLPADETAWFYGQTYHYLNMPDLARPQFEIARTFPQREFEASNQPARELATLAESDQTGESRKRSFQCAGTSRMSISRAGRAVLIGAAIMGVFLSVQAAAHHGAVGHPTLYPAENLVEHEGQIIESEPKEEGSRRTISSKSAIGFVLPASSRPWKMKRPERLTNWSESPTSPPASETPRA